MKDVLAETSLSNNLIQIIQVNQGKLDPESQQLIKMASDLLILLLTGGRNLYSWTLVSRTLISWIPCMCQSKTKAKPHILKIFLPGYLKIIFLVPWSWNNEVWLCVLCVVKSRSKVKTLIIFFPKKHDIISPNISFFGGGGGNLLLIMALTASFFLLSTQIKELKPCLLMEKVQCLLNLLNGWRMRTADYKWLPCWP